MCSMRGGCPEEMYTADGYVYPYCERHFKMIENGYNVTGVCQHPSCVRDIFDVPYSYCSEHSK